MKRESKNWVVISKKSILRWGKIVRQQRKDYNLSSNSSAQIKCEQCDGKVTVDKDEFKEKWTIYFRKAQVVKDENDGYSFQTRIEFYCLECEKKN